MLRYVLRRFTGVILRMMSVALHFVTNNCSATLVSSYVVNGIVLG